MEVHAHTHTARKKWTHYFWEFLMLFLAVFCGFLAEYQLEHKIEKNREKVYIKNMVEDLESDTTSYKKYVKDIDFTLERIDSLMYLLKSPEKNTRLNRIYYLARRITMSTGLLITNERTYEQMKSSGHLRLIHNQKISDSISYYYNELKLIKNQNDRINERFDNYVLSMNKLFDAELLLKIFKTRKEPEGSLTKLLTDDPMVINELLTRAQYLYGTLATTQNFGLKTSLTAGSLIELIKEHYHID